jgi:hypothetical protein
MREQPQSGQEKSFEKSKKVLDKPHKMWYNKGVKRARGSVVA